VPTITIDAIHDKPIETAQSFISSIKIAKENKAKVEYSNAQRLELLEKCKELNERIR